VARATSLALIHNGIIENFHSLKKGLLAEGVQFDSETDTEVAAKIVGREFDRRVT
jgi:glucosamine--fructose-6-phosphate aminotransferase (isomerizing)